MERRDGTLSPWHRRRELPALPLPGAAAASVILCLIAALSARSGLFALFSAAVSGTLFAALLLLYRSPFVLTVPAAASAAVIFCAHSALSAAAALIFIPLGCAASFAVYRGMSRLAASVLCASAVAVYAAVYGAALLIVLRMNPVQGGEVLRSSAEAWLASLTLPGPGGQAAVVFSAESAEILVDSLTPLLPSLAAGMLFFLGSAVTALLKRIIAVLGAGGDFFRDAWRIRAGRGCSAVYCGAQCAVLLAAATPRAEPLYYAAYNVAAIFMLPLAFCALGVLIRQLRSLDSVGAMTKAAAAVLAIMLAAAGIYWFFTAAALYGVYLAFRRAADGE